MRWMNLTGDLSWCDSLQTAEIVKPVRVLKQQQSGLLLHGHLNIIHTTRHQTILTCHTRSYHHSQHIPGFSQLLIKPFTCMHVKRKPRQKVHANTWKKNANAWFILLISDTHHDTEILLCIAHHFLSPRHSWKPQKPFSLLQDMNWIKEQWEW